MATVVVNITTKKQALPSSPGASNNNRFQLLQGSTVVSSVTVGGGFLQATFNNVADGDYTVAAQRMDMNNNPMGTAAVSSVFTVVNTTVVDVPDVINISMS